MTNFSGNNNGAFPIRTILITALISISVFAAAAYYGGYLMTTPMEKTSNKTAFGDTKDSENLYSCGMHPWVVSKEPGNCPICGMALTPKRNEKSGHSSSGKRKIAYWRGAHESDGDL